MLETVIISNTKMYRWVPNPPPVLRAWVENPNAHKLGEPAYWLCDVIEVEKGEATIKPIDSQWFVIVPVSLVHCVHDYDAVKRRVVKVYGEPKVRVV